MAKFVPNENAFIGFIATLAGTTAAPAAADITSAVDLTKLVVTVNASTQGSAVPTPTLDTKFQTSIDGEITSTFSMDMYRDDVDANDLGWVTLPRGTTGFILISRHGGKPTTGKKVEVWPVTVLSRSHAAMSSGQSTMFTVTCANPDVPQEDAVVGS